MRGAQGRQGTIVQGVHCPKCRVMPVVYNGNYFCDNLSDGCDWAMSDTNSAWNRRVVAMYLIQEGHNLADYGYSAADLGP